VIEFSRILCPTDLSEIAPRAFGQALALARFYQAEIEVLYVTEPVLPSPSLPSASVPWAPTPARRERVHEQLAALVAPARDVGVRANGAIREGRVVHEILERARAWPADLLVTGTHGRGGFERWVLGSVTEKVLRQAPCPVLTVPPTAHGLRPKETVLVRRIVAPVDFSAPSVAALGHALRLAEESGAELTLVHVLEWLGEDDRGARLSGFDVPEYRRYLEGDARDRLHGLVPAEARDWCQPREEVVRGRSWREILRIAEERDADLVVMGVRGRGAVDLTFFGSTTHHVVRGASCPVLVVHTD
jgi:nucleotide-binding universal stress UspA family protein